SATTNASGDFVVFRMSANCSTYSSSAREEASPAQAAGTKARQRASAINHRAIVAPSGAVRALCARGGIKQTPPRPVNPRPEPPDGSRVNLLRLQQFLQFLLRLRRQLRRLLLLQLDQVGDEFVLLVLLQQLVHLGDLELLVLRLEVAVDAEQ